LSVFPVGSSFVEVFLAMDFLLPAPAFLSSFTDCRAEYNGRAATHVRHCNFKAFRLHNGLLLLDVKWRGSEPKVTSLFRALDLVAFAKAV
jgi:hypothetical protein